MPAVCASCGRDMPVTTRCRAEAYRPWIGREGRHGGGCWGGTFPTAEGIAEWRKRLEKRRARAAAAGELAAAEPVAESQLVLELGSIERELWGA